jgi:hypothetical protein
MKALQATCIVGAITFTGIIHQGVPDELSGWHSQDLLGAKPSLAADTSEADRCAGSFTRSC